MTDEENEPMDALDRLIADAARDYHTPPKSVPRDDMWTAIVAARATAATPPAVEASSLPGAEHGVVSLVERRAERDARAERAAKRRGLWAVAAAAAVFLATGVGVGRWIERGKTAVTPTPAPTQVAATPVATPAATLDGATPNVDGTVVPPDRSPVATVSRPAAPARATVAPTTGGNDAYDMAVVRHFAQAEALLVSYRTDTVDAGMDRRLAQWARPLLADTRLLLDSPAASDPRRRRLLEDLELVLAQVARLAPTVATDSTARDRGERSLIDGSMRRAQILPRLRTVVPAGT